MFSATILDATPIWAASCKKVVSQSDETSYVRHSDTRNHYGHLRVRMLLQNKINSLCATFLHAIPLWATFVLECCFEIIYTVHVRHSYPRHRYGHLRVRMLLQNKINSLCATFLHATPLWAPSGRNVASKSSTECFMRQPYTRHRYGYLRVRMLLQNQINSLCLTCLHAIPLWAPSCKKVVSQLDETSYVRHSDTRNHYGRLRVRTVYVRHSYTRHRYGHLRVEMLLRSQLTNVLCDNPTRDTAMGTFV